jgi:cytochrome P450
MTETVSNPEIGERQAAHRRDYFPYADTPIEEHLAEMAARREEAPVSWSGSGGGSGYWVLTRYDDISDLLRRNNRGVVSFPNEPDGINRANVREAMAPIELDGSAHKQYRAILDPQFAPRKVFALEDELREKCNLLIDEFIEDGKVDFGNHFALPFPGATVLAIMGWPREDLERMNHWADVIMHGIAGASQEDDLAARGQAHQEFSAYMDEKIPQWRAAPRGDDVMSVMLDAELDGVPLTDNQLFDFSLLMMLAGLDTVQSVLGRSILHFATHQDQWDQMFADPDQVDAAIEELLRVFTPPVPTRTVTDDFLEYDGTRIEKGERIHAPLSAGNRDPKYYPNPDEVDFDRPAKPHLAFGIGTHRCVGLHLARLELKIAFTELHRRIPRFAVDTDAPAPHEHLGQAWGVTNVHLTFEPGPRELS